MDSINENPQEIPKENKPPEDSPMPALTTDDVQRVAIDAITPILETWQKALLDKVQKLIDVSLAGYIRETSVTEVVNQTIDKRIGSMEQTLHIISQTLDVKLNAIADDAREAKAVSEMARDLAQQSRDDAKEARHKNEQTRADIFGEAHRPGISQMFSENMADLIKTNEQRHVEMKGLVEGTFKEALRLIGDIQNNQHDLDGRLKRIEPFINGLAKVGFLVKKGAGNVAQYISEHPRLIGGLGAAITTLILTLLGQQS